MNIIKQVKSLNLPFGEYMVAGSGIMAAKGIRDSNDLDLLVSRTLFDQLKTKEEWEELPWTKPWTDLGLESEYWLKKNSIEVTLELAIAGDATKIYKLDDLILKSEFIEGINFLSLEKLIEFKKAYGRDKDLKDVKLIEEYLKNNT